MNIAAIKKIEKVIPLLAETNLEISLRRQYLKKIINKSIKDDADLLVVDAYIGLVNILVHDFYHSLAKILVENNKNSLGVINIYKILSNPCTKDYLQEKWQTEDHNFFLENLSDYNKIFHKSISNPDMTLFDQTYTNIIERGKVLVESGDYNNLKTIRDKLTAHFEIKNDNERMRIFEFQDVQLPIDNVFKLSIETGELISNMYLIITGGKYNSVNVIKRQELMADNLAVMLPIIV